MDIIGSDFKNLKTTTDFCPDCGNLLDLPIYTDFIECHNCNYKCHAKGKNINL